MGAAGIYEGLFVSKFAATTAFRLGAVAALGVAISIFLWGSSQPADAQTNGIILGAYAQPIDGQTNQEAFEKLEGTLGTQLPMIRAYAEWDDGVGQDKPLHRWARDGGRELFVSVKPKREDGSIVTWNEITNAQPGSRIYGEMQTLARGIKNYGEPVIFGFHHEPEASTRSGFGDSDDFKAAYRKVHSVFAAEGVTNANWAWIMTEWSFHVGDFNPDDRRVAEKWYPGDDVVDFIASDTYNWNNCRPDNDNDPWTTMEQELAPLMRFSANHPDKKLVLAEFGSDEGAPGQKAAWINEARALFKTAPYNDAFAALLYFHDDGREEGWPNCDWWLDSAPDTGQAAANWFRDDFFNGSLSAPTATPTPTPTTGPPLMCNDLVVTVDLSVGQSPTNGADVIRGTAGPDTIDALGGNDTICSLGGDDVIRGGAGFDKVFAGAGNDTISGNDGNDRLVGGSGNDTISGDNGNDRLQGGDGNDTLSGDGGLDYIAGNSGNDVLRGGSHDDELFGHLGRDQLFGDGGDDTLRGGAWLDIMNGGTGQSDGCTINDPAGLSETRANCEKGVFG